MPSHKLELPPPVDQLDDRNHPAIVLVDARPEFFARHGSISATWRRRGQKTFGPYYRLSYRDGPRQAAIYLGREGPLVALVRQRLDRLRAPYRKTRLFDQIERETRRALRANNARLKVLLAPYGLRLKGMEVRGWRTSFFPIRPPVLSASGIHCTPRGLKCARHGVYWTWSEMGCFSSPRTTCRQLLHKTR
jgi:hypothetical protein